MKRYHINKQGSARKFKSQIGRTKAPNIHRQIMRGGYRL